ncbi:hypothetical protein LR48_Vigan07g201700 [Vigna angularis]|uniref:Uncharacterized protein n=1 Tax=Phaseolus angularis TaxID=3914 RepID=A0A0L9UZV8_PHAAN|nr:hypothetical protein LR48_Vigan07g201700 [Vigna angularis]
MERETLATKEELRHRLDDDQKKEKGRICREKKENCREKEEKTQKVWREECENLVVKSFPSIRYAIKWKRTLELLFFDVMKKFHNIVSGDDYVSIKSGWDEYGIKFAKDIFVKGMNLTTMKYVFRMTGAYKSNPDLNYDPKALPNITRINYRDVVATQVKMSTRLHGISNNPFTNICISNVTIQFNEKPKKHKWNCTDVSGVTNKVTPPPCESLPEKEQSEADGGDENGGSEKHYPNQKPKTQIHFTIYLQRNRTKNQKPKTQI